MIIYRKLTPNLIPHCIYFQNRKPNKLSNQTPKMFYFFVNPCSSAFNIWLIWDHFRLHSGFETGWKNITFSSLNLTGTCFHLICFISAGRRNLNNFRTFLNKTLKLVNFNKTVDMTAFLTRLLFQLERQRKLRCFIWVRFKFQKSNNNEGKEVE